MSLTTRFHLYAIEGKNPEYIYDILESCLEQVNFGANLPRYQPLRRCVQLIEQLNVACILRQQNVQDPDFIAEHAAYYSRWTKPVPRYCERLHLFSVTPSGTDPLHLIDAASDDDYLGFITLRPISMSPVAATILKPPRENNTRYLLARDEFPVNIAGRSFTVRGTPFLQQDNAVGACAQAAIWMALRTMRKREGQAAYSPAQITSAATRFYVLGRTLPNRTGLHLQQVAEAVRSSGYSPHLLPLHHDSEDPQESIRNKKRTLYPYIESGIPVLLLLFPSDTEGHAVVLIGHGWKPNPAELIQLAALQTTHWSDALTIFDPASWIEPLLIHNDNSGPYLDLPAQGHPYSLSQARFAIPLLKPDVFIDGAEAQEATLRLLRDIFDQLQLKSSPSSNGIAPKIVARTYLQERSEFRQHIRKSEASDDLRRYYREKWLPRRFWVTELNDLNHYEKAPSGAPLRLGEVLLDAAAEAEDGAFLTIRLGERALPATAKGIENVIVDRDGLTGRIYAFPIKGTFDRPLRRDSI